ncbi:MAG TPA: cyanophycin synthetase, partial [Myxococcota bacterium]|nr:cyanophycin synthetase [Myxococcota bacterium]
ARGEVQVRLPGVHYAQNALAALAVADFFGVPFEVYREAMAGFAGVDRRFSLRGEAGGVLVVDDYGHHPTEIAATIAAARLHGRRLVVAFQPHRHSRTQDLMNDFAPSLAGADVVVLTDIYAAGEPAIEDVNIERLRATFPPDRRPHHFPRRGLCDGLVGLLRPGDLLLTLGAGDITQVAPEVLGRLGAGTEPTLEAITLRARRGAGRVRGLPTAPFMHGAAHWAAFTMWHTGATVCVQSAVRGFDARDVLATVERERVNALTIVGDAFARPLLDALRERDYDLGSLQTITSGGAILTASVKDELLARIPQARILDVLGSSESGQQATQVSRAGKKATTGDFALAASNVVLSEDLTRVLAAGSDEAGWLARSGPVPLGYYKDAEKTARTFPVIGGVRYSVPGDRAIALAGGGLKLLGRDSVTINSGGEKIFAEEIEHALKHHPAVWDAVVTGTPHERFGQQVTAVVALRAGASVSEAELRAACEAHLARYKLPRVFVFVDEIVRAPSGKADYRWAREVALARRPQG